MANSMFVKISLLATLKCTKLFFKRCALVSVMICCAFSLLTACNEQGGKSKFSDSQLSLPKQKLLFGADIFEPYIYFGDDGRITGIDYELAAEACKRLGYDFEFKIMSWNDKDELLEKAQVDAIWACYDMTGHEQEYSWAGPYLSVVHGVLVRDDSGITSFKDLQTRKICMQRSSQPEKWFTSAPLNVNPDKPHVKELLMFSTPEEAFTAFEQKACDAVSGYQGILSALSRNISNTRILDEGIMSVGVGVAFYKNGNLILAEALDRTLRQMRKDGFIQRTVEKYGLSYHDPNGQLRSSVDAQ